MSDPFPSPAHTTETSAETLTRWGGAILSIGAFLYTLAIILYVIVYGQPKRTGPGGEVTVGDSAAHLLAHWRLVKGLWLMEMTAALLIAVAAFALPNRRQTTRSLIPTRVAWLAVGIGATLLAAMYAFILGSYPPALAAFQQDSTVFASLRGGATVLFYAACAITFLGLGAAFFGETSMATRVIPKWVAFAGAGVTLLATLQAGAMLAGFKELPTAGPSAVVAFALTGWFGMSLSRASRRVTTHKRTGTLGG
jgi:hypothetical protein